MTRRLHRRFLQHGEAPAKRAKNFRAQLRRVGAVFSAGTLFVAYVIAWILMPEA